MIKINSIDVLPLFAHDLMFYLHDNGIIEMDGASGELRETVFLDKREIIRLRCEHPHVKVAFRRINGIMMPIWDDGR